MRCGLLALSVCLLLGSASASNALNFSQGFLLGLQKNPNAPDACAADSSTLLQDTESVVSYIQEMMSGNTGVLTSLIIAGQKLANDLKGFNGDCNFTELLENIEAIATPDGFSKVIWTYLNNKQTIDTDWSSMQSCQENYTACGQAAGQVFSLITNWSI
jgi:hypothetical protein